VPSICIQRVLLSSSFMAIEVAASGPLSPLSSTSMTLNILPSGANNTVRCRTLCRKEDPSSPAVTSSHPIMSVGFHQKRCRGFVQLRSNASLQAISDLSNYLALGPSLLLAKYYRISGQQAVELSASSFEISRVCFHPTVGS